MVLNRTGGLSKRLRGRENPPACSLGQMPSLGLSDLPVFWKGPTAGSPRLLLTAGNVTAFSPRRKWGFTPLNGTTPRATIQTY